MPYRSRIDVEMTSCVYWEIVPYYHLMPANNYFFVNNIDLVKQLPLNLIDASQSFFHYQPETNKQPRSQGIFLKKALAPHDFAGNFYLI